MLNIYCFVSLTPHDVYFVTELKYLGLTAFVWLFFVFILVHSEIPRYILGKKGANKPKDMRGEHNEYPKKSE